MHHIYHIQGKVSKEEINRNETKKEWMAPEVEVLDGRKTYGGDGTTYAEGTDWVPEEEIVS